MRALNMKLLRDLWRLRAQAIAIALVIAGGVATWVISLSTVQSLQTSQRLYYQDYRFADVFATLKRAPRGLRRTIEQIDGVGDVDLRVRAPARLNVSGFDEPVEALLTSIPDHRQPQLNRLFIERGRLPEPMRDHEVLISKSFADAHGLGPGDTLEAIIRGRKTTLTICGTGLSPEFVYQIRPGALFPDYKRYAVMWMRRHALERAADMEGAFNDAVLALRRHATPAQVIDELDQVLARWGGTGAIDRDDQTSHSYLREEMEQLSVMASIVPLIFLGVAAFLLSIVVRRLIAMQRDQIAILKAFGYSNRVLGLHYCLMVLAMVVLGIVPGVAVGAWLGHGLAEIYRDFFSFPELYYQVTPAVIAGGALISIGAALAGTGRALIQAFRLAPAEAMRPEPPHGFKRGLVERLPLLGRLDQPTRMILRNLERRPLKAVLAIVGISLATAILVIGRYQGDTINYMLDVQFGFAAREDLTVTFTEPTQREALSELEALPGVVRAEPFRAVPVELISGHRHWRSVIQAFSADAALHRALDAELLPIELPPDGLLLTDWLAEQLHLSPGERVTVQVLERARPRLELPIAGVVREFVGASAYMRLEALNATLGEAGSLSGAYLLAAPGRVPDVVEELDRRPRVAASNLREAMIDSFERTMGENILIFALVNTVLAGVVAFGVTYNTARLALSERARELASLRVLGYRRIEITWVLLGELALITLLAIPLGLWIGTGFAVLIGKAMASEFYRIPAVIQPSSYAFAAAVVLLAMAISAVAVARRLYHLDLVEVLKTRE